MLRRLAAALLLLALAAWTQAATLARVPGESVERFARRNAPPAATLAHRVIEARLGRGPAKAIVAFYEEEYARDGQAYRRVLGTFFVPEGRDRYRRVLIDVYEPEGGDPHVEAVFFAEAGSGKRRKLVVICSWPQVHHDFRGTLYATYVYELPGPGAAPARLTLDEALGRQLRGGCECEWRDGRKTTAKYKTAADVRPALRRIAR